jgi:hypothetical protein
MATFGKKYVDLKHNCVVPQANGAVFFGIL